MLQVPKKALQADGKREEPEFKVGHCQGAGSCLQVQKNSHGPTGDAIARYSQVPWVIHLQSAKLLRKWIIG